jgi:excinuclease ABC subunit A
VSDADHASISALNLPPDAIAIRGAREHNLKNLSVDIPRGKFVVVTGVSGSGKSTLAFDLLFAEGQRRFLDSMSAYARQFVEQLARPDVDLIAGLPPTVSIEQNTSRGGGKSTVATVTEIHHFIRLLFARLGTQFCPDCQLPVEAQTRDEITARIVTEASRRGPLKLMANVVRNRKGFHSDIAVWAENQGYSELRADGVLREASEGLRLDRFSEHDIEVVVGEVLRTGKPSSSEKSLRELVEDSLTVGKGVLLAMDRKGVVTVHATERACPKCRRSFAPLDPKNFSYNSSQGWCPKCRGFGELFYLPEVERGANAESVEESWWRWQEGKREPCPECHGARLQPEARAVRLRFGPPTAQETPPGINLDRLYSSKKPNDAVPAEPTMDDFARATVASAMAWVGALTLEGRAAEVARDILPEIRERLKFLAEVGLEYLELGRAVPTLSGGEAQRIRLSAQLGSNLSGVLYILDEPTIGLHSRDNDRLLDTLERLRDRGNSLVVVEHDVETMRRADHVIDLGPGAGILGGRVMAQGTLQEVIANPASPTGRSLAATTIYPTRGSRRIVQKDSGGAWLSIPASTLHNLKAISARIPLGRFTVVTGVSGSGKSTLVKQVLVPAVASALAAKKGRKKSSLPGIEAIRALHEVDQSPIGRTPRSTPATYVGFFDDIRKLFATTNEARIRGYGPGRFSFNSAAGRCPECSGTGSIALEMNFLATAHIPCETCRGRRFNPETLEVHWNGKSIADVLDLSVGEALEFFTAHTKLRRPLEALRDTGLAYLRLGQISPTLSGGEAQRIKLVSHLLSGLRGNPAELPSRAEFAGTIPQRDLFILEEPTVGLHLEDVRRLVEIIQRLVDSGHTVVVIEHNLELIAEADWVIDLGPEGGKGGGRIIATGTPEDIVQSETSHTGRYLRPLLPAIHTPGKKRGGLASKLTNSTKD